MVVAALCDVLRNICVYNVGTLLQVTSCMHVCQDELRRRLQPKKGSNTFWGHARVLSACTTSQTRSLPVSLRGRPIACRHRRMQIPLVAGQSSTRFRKTYRCTWKSCQWDGPRRYYRQSLRKRTSSFFYAFFSIRSPMKRRLTLFYRIACGLWELKEEITTITSIRVMNRAGYVFVWKFRVNCDSLSSLVIERSMILWLVCFL